MVPLAVIAITDLAIGVSPINLFTWSAWLVSGLAFLGVRRMARRKLIMGATLVALTSNAWFFLWTNLGVWLLGRGVYCASGWSGLVSTYVGGLPFFRNMAEGTLVLVPSAVLLTVIIERRFATNRIGLDMLASPWRVAIGRLGASVGGPIGDVTVGIGSFATPTVARGFRQTRNTRQGRVLAADDGLVRLDGGWRSIAEVG
jgi:hypothetical protein